MNIKHRKIAGMLLAGALLCGSAACQSEAAPKAGASADVKSADSATSPKQSPTQIVAAAYQKTKAAKSAKIRATMTGPAAKGGASEQMEMTGVMGWNPLVMDMTVTGSALTAEPGAPDKVRMVWLDNAMYMDLGAANAKEMDGKHWMKLDLAAAAKASGNGAAAKAMTGGMENMNQDPSQQLALLLASPDLKHLGSETMDGVQAQHFKGRIALDGMMKTNAQLSEVLDAKEQKALVDTMKKAGFKAFDTEIWVNKEGYPVRMDVGMDSSQGPMQISEHFSDYGAQAQVQAPPAAETVDLFKMLGDLGDLGGAGADGGTDSGA